MDMDDDEDEDEEDDEYSDDDDMSWKVRNKNSYKLFLKIIFYVISSKKNQNKLTTDPLYDSLEREIRNM